MICSINAKLIQQKIILPQLA